jgi:hypothetical protein
MVGLAFRPSMTMTGVIVRIRTATTTATCVPKTAAVPSFAIQAGWKYPTEKPLAVRQALMMAETTVDWSGYFSRLYAVIELLHTVISSSSHTVGKADSHCTGDHAKHNHEPTKGETNPVLMVVQGHAVCEQSTSHDSNGNPDTVQSILGTPLLLTGFLNPAVKPVAKCIS